MCRSFGTTRVVCSLRTGGHLWYFNGGSISHYKWNLRVVSAVLQAFSFILWKWPTRGIRSSRLPIHYHVWGITKVFISPECHDQFQIIIYFNLYMEHFLEFMPSRFAGVFKGKVNAQIFFIKAVDFWGKSKDLYSGITIRVVVAYTKNNQIGKNEETQSAIYKLRHLEFPFYQRYYSIDRRSTISVSVAHFVFYCVFMVHFPTCKQRYQSMGRHG